MKIYADSGNLEALWAADEKFKIDGFTTNPTLMAAGGATDYLEFARALVSLADDRPVSFEVFSDDPDEIRRQADVLMNEFPDEPIYVKIPIVDSQGRPLSTVIQRAAESGIAVNVTAVFTRAQIYDAYYALHCAGAPGIISVFAGRIADAGWCPDLFVSYAKSLTRTSSVDVLWASTREAFNVVQAEIAGADIITIGTNLFPKLQLRYKDLNEYSIETSAMFLRDAERSGFKL